MFSIEAVNDEERRDVVHARLRQSNSQLSARLRGMRGTLDEEDPLQVYATGADGTLAGGLVGHTQWGWLHVDLLWVDEHHRGAGLGSRLLARAEELAGNERGCIGSRVETWDFQAPGFYGKAGYRTVCVTEDYPPGITNYLLVKSLRPQEG
ncbi:GNAT family N-acetyltransferase [Streptomyces netropsis]|uniref:GNAT superfamily N-acetyltransferase n=1 Tax=Streptomyces netropsis TaxID=55404 RepID=A0A7W7LB81_STRNE|nr:GNAT family N-acetyltransferase [Streptomyces netropsis]MBB4887034.1 GNAT superfamily N-acetyltransferase [Streptomyces netropsis]